MSGSGGGISPSFKNEELLCEDISFSTKLASPNPDVIATLNVGDLLEILSEPPSGLRAYTKDGKLAGSLLTSYRNKLNICLAEGYRYVGKVSKLSGGSCEIYVTVI